MAINQLGIPDATDWSWFTSLPLDLTGKMLLFYPDGRVCFRHVCDRGERGVIICAPALRLDQGGHRITTRDPISNDVPVTVEPSVSCPDCGTHGFVTNGRWIPA